MYMAVLLTAFGCMHGDFMLEISAAMNVLYNKINKIFASAHPESSDEDQLDQEISVELQAINCCISKEKG